MVPPLDALDCRSPTACGTCEYAGSTGQCQLEGQIALALQPARRPEPRIHLRLLGDHRSHSALDVAFA